MMVMLDRKIKSLQNRNLQEKSLFDTLNRKILHEQNELQRELTEVKERLAQLQTRDASVVFSIPSVEEPLENIVKSLCVRIGVPVGSGDPVPDMINGIVHAFEERIDRTQLYKLPPIIPLAAFQATDHRMDRSFIMT